MKVKIKKPNFKGECKPDISMLSVNETEQERVDSESKNRTIGQSVRELGILKV